MPAAAATTSPPRTPSASPHLGALPTSAGVRFRVWAPNATSVDLIVLPPRGPAGGQWTLAAPAALASAARTQAAAVHAMQRAADGYFELEVPQLRSGALYCYRIDDKGPYPDPCSRFQPEGPHGPSRVVDPNAHRWTDGAWSGLKLRGQVLYELHIGTFTREGTFDAAIAQLPELKALGVTCLELMPVAEFPGRWNWGYDGVDLFAPYHGYGDYDALKRFVDAAHAQQLGVILDVVYNHLGPDGNYVPCFSPHYLTDRYANEWGQAIDFDGPNSRAVREFFIENACYWVRDFHLDGLRLDATQSIFDRGPRHVLLELARRTRAAAAPRSILLMAENEPQRVECLLPGDAGGYELDAMWNDDFHHSARVALTGTHDGYFHDYRGRPQEFISAVKRGFLYQGQYYPWQKKARGTPLTDQSAERLITFIQNHDQVGNTLDGIRIHQLTSPARLRAMTALLLLSPQTPLLFMGQEFAASSRFHFFADHNPDLAAQVHQGRRSFLGQFQSFASEEAQAQIKDPAQEATFRGSVLDFSERQRNAAIYQLHKDLLALRRNDPVIAMQDRTALDGAVVGDAAFLLRWFDGELGDRLLLVNLRDQLELEPAPEPLLAPPWGRDWQLAWSSEDPTYGGVGSILPCAQGRFLLAAECAVLLCSSEVSP